MELRINKKAFFTLTGLLALIIPYFFLYTQSAAFSQIDNLDATVWWHTGLVVISTFCVAIMVFVKNRAVSFLLVYTPCVVAIAIEPIFCYTVLPFVIVFWCMKSLSPEDRGLFYFVFIGILSVSAATGVVLLWKRLAFFITVQSNAVRVVLVAVFSLIGLASFATVLKATPKNLQKHFSKKHLAEFCKTRNELVGFFLLVFAVINLLAMIQFGLSFVLFKIVIILYFILTVIFLNHIYQKRKGVSSK